MLKTKPSLFVQCRFVRKMRDAPKDDKIPAKFGFVSELDFGRVRTSLIRKEQPPEQKSLFPTDPDAPIQLSFNPFQRADRRCLLCELGIKLDYKNGRILQQFVSSFSGRIYDQHVTGLCNKQYKNLLATIAISRKAGHMPVMVRDAKYLRDPKLFDPFKSVRPHSYD